MSKRYNPDLHHRHSIRLPEYDYAQCGAYFVTICAIDRQHLFGEIVDGVMQTNVYGQIVEAEWLQTAVVRPYVTLDAFVVMPNHVHGIIMLDAVVRATRRVALTTSRSHRSAARPNGPVPGSIGAIVGQFKSAATKRINEYRDTPAISIWQRNYYEHIIRDERAHRRIREYIADNPRRWAEDEYC